MVAKAETIDRRKKQIEALNHRDQALKRHQATLEQAGQRTRPKSARSKPTARHY